MSDVELIRNALQRLHGSLDEAMEDLSQEQAHWRPYDQGNHIAFIAWHYTRTVDNVVRFLLQRRPTVWLERKLDEKFGLDSKAQGSGMAAQDAASLGVSDVPAFCVYMKAVWEEAQAYLDTVTEDELSRELTVRPLGDLTVRELLATTLLTHGFTHLGEIWLLRGLQGLRGSPI